MPDRRDHRHRHLRDGARDALGVEGSKILDRATAARHDQHLHGEQDGGLVAAVHSAPAGLRSRERFGPVRGDPRRRDWTHHLLPRGEHHPARTPPVTATPPLSLDMRLDTLLDGLARGDTTALARAISLVENQRPGFEEVLSRLHARVGRPVVQRIGITGPPGAGKSTLTEQLVRAFRERGLKVAVIAVDPTSPFTGGALLGDRIRMEAVTLDPGVFIRSMATRGAQGGLATTTEEVTDVLEAFGFDRILIETVGVGQTELDVAATAETTVLVLVPESGDGIQALKAGVMEIADIYVVNKSDRPGAEKLRQEIEIMLGIRKGNAFAHVGAHHGRADGPTAGRSKPVAGPSGRPAGRPADWEPPVLTTVASKGNGIPELISVLDQHRDFLERTRKLAERRKRRLAARTRAVVNRAIRQWVWDETDAEALLARRLDDIAAGTRSPYDVAAAVLQQVRNGK